MKRLVHGHTNKKYLEKLLNIFKKVISNSNDRFTVIGELVQLLKPSLHIPHLIKSDKIHDMWGGGD